MSRFPRMVCVAARPIRTAPHTTTGMRSATPARLRRQGILDLLERGSWGGAALSYARCRPPVNGFLRDRSSIPDYFPSTNVTRPGATRIIGDAVTQPASQLALTELGGELVRGLPIDELDGGAVAPHLMPGLVRPFPPGILACRAGL